MVERVAKAHHSQYECGSDSAIHELSLEWKDLFRHLDSSTRPLIFRQFLAVSRGSLFELQTQLKLCADLGYLCANAFREVMEQCEEIARMLNGLLGSIARDRGRTANEVSKLADSLTH